MSWKDKLNTGEIIFFDDPEFMAEQRACLETLYDINRTRPGEKEKRQALFSKFFGSAGKNLYIELPLHANWGRNTYFGDDCYANFNLTLVDDGDIFIGSHCMIAPNVVIATAGHPLDPALRRRKGQYSKPVHIGENVWLGANVVVMPGVTIGDNAVIGAGSVVTKDVPADAVAYGNPCRVMKTLSERDAK
ncbi:MAG: sugar O-acetyltransferase [Clostridiales bacterium]|nr:sugar O-acetyltransferase [Clostridiales bacterium]